MRILYTPFLRLCVFLGSVIVLCSQAGCESQLERRRHGRDPHDVTGWQFVDGRSQLLARDYPALRWLSLTFRCQGKAGLLFKAPAPSNFNASGPLLDLLRPRGPRMPWQSRRKSSLPKTPRGLVLSLRASHALSLQLRLYTKRASAPRFGLAKQNSAPAVLAPVYVYTLHIPRTGRRWYRRKLRYTQFLPLSQAPPQQGTSRPSTTRPTTRNNIPSSRRAPASQKQATSQATPPTSRPMPSSPTSKAVPPDPSPALTHNRIRATLEFWEIARCQTKEQHTLTLTPPRLFR